uniref:Uroplakin 3B n=1 Tax=Monodelphis domestica TaxID=13616 RepID=F6UVW9_MONDO
MGFPQGRLLLLPLLLLTGIQTGTSLEPINYTPAITREPLEGSITSSTFTLDQPNDQFNGSGISDLDDIWLVVAFSNASQSFEPPQSAQDIPYAATFLDKKYYLTIRASRDLYSSKRGSQGISVLRVGNETNCTRSDCNKPLPGPGPYRVKFLVMNTNGPVAGTNWSEDITLRKPVEFSESRPPSKSAGTIVIIAILSILLSLLFLALVALLVYTW